MRAVVHHEFAEPADVLTVEDVPLPEPGPGEVRVRTLLATIHNHDVWTVRGTYGFKPELPARAGTEAVGVVDAVGPGVERVQVGQRVATGGSFGAWAEYFLADAAGLIPVPDAIPDEAAAQLVAMPSSAIGLLYALDLAPGDWLIQNAASGAVGRMLAQLARARDLHVVGLVRRAAAVEELAAQGIDRVVATDSEGWQDRVRELTGGAPIRAGVDSVGGKEPGQMLSLLADNGTLVVFGAMAAPTIEIGSGDLIFGQRTVTGYWGKVVMETMDTDTKRALFGELITRVLDGSLTLPVDGVYAFEDVRDAVRASLAPGHQGKVLLRP